MGEDSCATIEVAQVVLLLLLYHQKRQEIQFLQELQYFIRTHTVWCRTLHHRRRPVRRSRCVLVQGNVAGNQFAQTNKQRLVLYKSTEYLGCSAFLKNPCQTQGKNNRRHSRLETDSLVLPYSSARIHSEANVRRALVLGVL